MMKLIPAAMMASALLLGACAQQSTASKSVAASTVSAAVADQANVTARGTFEGKSNHVTTGHASIGRAGKKWVVILEDDFTFDGAPDPHVALGANGYQAEARLALLQSNAGKQVYEIPASLDVANFNEIWIWCKKFNVPLGKAKLALI